LLSDELGGEGRNFQIADAIIHIDLPWTPALVEQRIGRVDRIGRTGNVRSIVVVARDTPEEQLFHLWHRAFQLFTRSMSGLEIALEQIQDEVAQTLFDNPRHGLAKLLNPMQVRVAELREIVEEEAYFDRGTINRRLRDDFSVTTTRYRDGKTLWQAIERGSRNVQSECRSR
jgi:superfamily II DNA/RNA helicase